MKTSIHLVLAVSMLSSAPGVFAQPVPLKPQTAVVTPSIAEQKTAQLKKDLAEQKNQLAALEKIQASGLGFSQVYGKHAVVVAGAAAVGLLVKGLNKEVNSSLVAGISTAVATLGEQIIVWSDENKLEEDVRNARYNVERIKVAIAKQSELNGTNSFTNDEIQKLNDLRDELKQANDDLQILVNISRTGVRFTTQVGKHAVAVGMATSVGLILHGSLREPNWQAIAGGSLLAVAIREAFIIANDASVLREMIKERRLVIFMLQEQIKNIENHENKAK